MYKYERKPDLAKYKKQSYNNNICKRQGDELDSNKGPYLLKLELL